MENSIVLEDNVNEVLKIGNWSYFLLSLFVWKIQF